MNVLNKSYSQIVIVLLLLSQSFTLNAQSNPYKGAPEYMVKAGFIGKFAFLTSWPKSKQSENFVIVVLGENPFDTFLEDLYKDYAIDGKNVKVEYIKTIEDLPECHVLFISNSERFEVKRIIKEVEEKSILIIGDTEGYADKGVHINLFQTRLGTIEFEINRKSIKRNNLKIEMELLQIAKKVL